MSDTHAQPTEPAARAGSLWLALAPALLVAGLTFAVGVASAYAAPPSGEMAVVFPPWVDEIQAFGLVAEAGGQIVGPSRFGNIVIAFASDTGFAARVAEQGALFTLKATGICGPAST